jgi:hypothetical protein
MTMDGNPTAGAPRFTVGGVISAALSVVFANFFRFLVIMIVVGVPTFGLVAGGIMVMAASTGTSPGAGFNFSFEGGNASQILFVVFAAFLILLAYFLIQAALTYGALQTLRGRPASIGACLSNGLAALPRVFLAALVLFAATVLAGLCVALVGSLLAAVAGGIGSAIVTIAMTAAFLYLIVLIWVFVPAIVVERAGPVQCFSRSMELTKGHRWGIFGILALITVVNWIVSFASQALAQLAPIGGSVIDIAFALFFVALGSALAAVGYYYLRAEKEGVAIDDVVTVFD